PEVQRDLRLRADKTAKFEEFIGAELIVFRHAPGEVQHGDTFVARTYAVAPVVGRSEVAAKSQEGDLHRFRHGDHVRIHALYVIRSHQRCQVNEHARGIPDHQNKIGRLKGPDSSLWHFKGERI